LKKIIHKHKLITKLTGGDEKMAVISFQLDDLDEKIIRKYAKSKQMSISSFLRAVVVEKIEDNIDDELYEQALSESKDDSCDITLEDVKKVKERYL
jgi:hypothetical protein